MTKRSAAAGAKARTAALEERVASLEGVLAGLATITIVFTAEGQLVRVVSSHGLTVRELKGAKIALQVSTMQLDEALMEAVRQEASQEVPGGPPAPEPSSPE